MPAPDQPIIVNRAEQRIVILHGWCGDPATGAACRVMSVTVDGTAAHRVLSGIERPDLVAFFHQEGYLYSGFYLSFASASLGPGPHRLTFDVATADGAVGESDRAVTLDVR